MALNSGWIGPRFALCCIFLRALPACCAAADPMGAETIAVSKAFDRAKFSYRSELSVEKDLFRVYRLSYPSPVRTAIERNNVVPAEFYLPRDIRPGGATRPAVICLHILDGNVELVQIACSALAARGIPALWFHLPYYGPRGPAGGRRAVAADPTLFASAIAQAVEDVKRTVDVLASRPEIDPARIGVMGISLGGILAATAAENDTRISRAALILSGGDLLPVIYQAKETQELTAMIRRLASDDRVRIERAIREADPLRHADLLRDRARSGKVLMVNAADDEVIPRACTEKLAAALGIGQRVVWLDGLGHYTALAALPRTLKATIDFFAEDLPPGVKPPAPDGRAPPPQQVAIKLLQQGADLLCCEPKEGCCHQADLELSAIGKDGKKIEGRLRLVRGRKPKFKIQCQLPGLGEVSLGCGAWPWMSAGPRVVFRGRPSDDLAGNSAGLDPLAYVERKHLMKVQVLGGALAALAMAPDVLDRWVTIADDPAPGEGPAIRITRKDRPGEYVRLVLEEDRAAPRSATFDVAGIRGHVIFHAWQLNAAAQDSMFREPAGSTAKEVAAVDLLRMFASAINFAAESFDKSKPQAADQGMRLIARDPAGHGLVCQSQNKTILMVSGTPEQMGAAHGVLLRDPIRRLCEHVLYLVGAGDSLRTGVWAFDRFAEIQRRTQPYLPQRFLVECDALARAAGISQRDGRAANLFPERFHCSGVAVRGKATSDGKVLHARVLDYMRDIHLQTGAAVTVFLPEGRRKWVSLGYGGFIGTVTAMNDKGLAVGEMGGRGEGDWDGMPMSFLLRDLMERADSVDAALEILRRAPRTCEYYYVLSDKSRAVAGVYCTPRQMTVLGPGQQHARLPRVPEDTVFISGGRRAEILSQRLQKEYGKIDPATLIDIIKRPVAMDSNLHDAIFAAETLDLWVADAGRDAPACDEPYAHFNLHALLRFYENANAERK
ncbi:MAG: C45 family autoproteolytic acyltransferase/hydrolase [Thermoguttaceae bacterium]